MNVKIIVDSTADLTAEAQKCVTVVPLTIRFGEEEYIDGVTIDSHKFYEMLIESDVLPTTSQANPAVFEEVFADAVKDGSQVVCITCASKLSGTYQSAVIAAEDYAGQVFVVDSQNIALGSAILIEYALELKDRGLSAEEIAWKLMQKREKVRLIAMLDTLEYLKKGGRISATVAFAGGLLLGYTGLTDALLQKYIADSASLWEGNCENLPISVVGSVVGTHVGPGAVAVAFFSADEAE